METPNQPSPAAPAGTVNRAANAPAQPKLTRQQRDQLFSEAAQDMVPAHIQKEPEDPLKPWWPQIKQKLKEGFSVRQVHDMLGSPKIGLEVSFRSLQRLIAEHKETAANKVKGR